MKHAHLFVPLFVLIAFTLSFSQPQWVPTGGPEGGDVNCFAVYGSGVVYCGTSGGGVYASADSGGTWQPFGLLGDTVLTLAVDTNGTTLYAGVRSHKVMRADIGYPWVRADSSIAINDVWKVAVNSNNVLFALSHNENGSSFYRSTNHGDSWTAINSGLPSATVFFALGIAPNNDLYGSCFGAIYRSTNNGDSWTQTGSTGNYLFWNFAFDYTEWNDTLVYAGGDQIIKSTNSGQSWTQVGTLTSFCNALLVQVPYVYAATTQGILRNNLITSGWSNAGMSVNSTIAITHLSSKILVGTVGDGVYSSMNTPTWTQSHGISSVYPFTILMHDSSIYVGTTSGIFYSSINDSIWQRCSPLNTNILALAIDQNSVLYAGVNEGLLRTTDFGWSYTADLIGVAVTAVTTAPMGNLYAATSNGAIKRCTNGGINWTDMVTCPNRVNALFTLPTMIPESWQVFVESGNGLYRCLEDGRNWSLVGMAGSSVYQVCTTPNPGYLLAATSSGVYSSDNGGDTWTQTGFTQPAYALQPTVEGFFYFSSDSGVFVTNNFNTWSHYDDGLPPTRAVTLNSPFAGMAYAGVFRQLAPAIGVKSHDPAKLLPQHAQLLPNYPNPFNSTTVISFTLPLGTDTKVEIFNITGQLVQTLAKSRMAPGIHRVTWNAEALPSGLYWCRLSAGGETSVARMLYLK